MGETVEDSLALALWTLYAAQLVRSSMLMLPQVFHSPFLQQLDKFELRGVLERRATAEQSVARDLFGPDILVCVRKRPRTSADRAASRISMSWSPRPRSIWWS